MDCELCNYNFFIIIVTPYENSGGDVGKIKWAIKVLLMSNTEHDDNQPERSDKNNLNNK